MIPLPSGTKIWLVAGITDMRNGFNGLAAKVQTTLNEPGNIPGMSSSLPDDINALKRLLAEQEALNRALLEKLNEREREIDHLQAQLDKLRRMNFGSRSEKVSRRIAQMEADLNRLQKESDRERYADW